MARKRKGEKIDGWLVIDKPLNITSADVVWRVKRALSPQKIGHAGTLDPLATGILPLGLGEATKTMSYIVDQTKDYEFSVAWGQATSTDDCEGEIVAHSEHRPTIEEIEDILPEFIGEILQIPPVYSAIKIDGERAYARARAGEDVKMKPRTITIEQLRLINHDEKAGVTSFFVCCGKGTYVRSLGRDLAEKLGTKGHIVALRRTRVGPFSLKGAISLDLLDDMGHIAPACEAILPVMTALDDISALAITEQEADLIKMGQFLDHSTSKDGPLILTLDDVPVAIAEVAGGQIKPKRVFNLTKIGADDVDNGRKETRTD